MANNDLNKTHILVLRETNGIFEKVEMPIDRPEQFLNEIRAMADNPNRSVMDMQTHFIDIFPQSNEYFDHLYPYSYTDSYVGGVSYPDIQTYEQLCTSWDKIEEEARANYLAGCQYSGEQPDKTAEREECDEAVKRFKRNQKYKFLHDVTRWIDALGYSKTVKRLAAESSVKMISKENVGWNVFDHPINEDIRISLRTNFGFGSASYFILGVQYKGIDILPYSFVVKYFRANMADIIRYTRKYTPARESWYPSFDFVRDMVNRAVADPANFVTTYIMNEVKEMIEGLESIACNPRQMIEKIGDRKVDPCVISVYSMYSDDKQRLQAYPAEMPVLFKVEKLSGALKFLDNLKSIAAEVTAIQPYICRLLEMNRELVPEIEATALRLEDHLAQENHKKELLERKMSDITAEIKIYQEKIEILRNEKGKSFSISDFNNANPEYKNDIKEMEALKTSIRGVKQRIHDFTAFKELLSDAKKSIESMMEKQAA